MIECNQINQTVEYLLTAFQTCNQLSASDMQLLVELIAAVNTCANGGSPYNTLLNDIYEPEEDQIITYPPNNFHSISVVVSVGNAVYQSVLLPPGASINIEFTTTNQQAFSFTAKAGSKILVERIIETI